MQLKRFWQFYKPLIDALNAKDLNQATQVLDNMAKQEGPCDRWKQLVIRFVSAGGLLPDHLDAMMILGPTDDWLREYVARKRKSLSIKNLEQEGKGLMT